MTTPTLAQETFFTKIIPKEQYTDKILREIKPRSDLIICVPDLEQIDVDRDGSILIKSDRNYPLKASSQKLPIVTFEYIANVKFCLPRTFFPYWKSPLSNPFYFGINVSYQKLIQRNYIVNDIATDIPSYTIYGRPELTLIINLPLFNKNNKMGVIRKNDDVVALEFVRRYQVRSNYKDEETRSFLIENPGLFKNFENTFI